MSEITGHEINLNDVKPYIIANVNAQCKRNTTARMSIVGSPGCGKSDLMRQICQENGWGLSVKYLSNMSLEQITGIPCQVKEGEKARWTKPEIFNFEDLEYRPDNYIEGKSITILLIDDFHLADRVIQKYLFQLLTYKSLNGYKLPNNTAILLAGNRNTDKALANVIPAPVMNRIAVYEVKADVNDWLKNFAFSHGVRDDITSFLHSKGDVFLCQEPIENVPWASPRSWTFLSEQMDEFEAINGRITLENLKLIATSLIGTEYSSEFISYRELFAKWDFDQLSKYKHEELIEIFEKEVLKNASAVYAIVNSVSSWMINKIKEFKYNTSDPKLVNIVNFTYDVMVSLLEMKVKNIQVKPLVIAGTNYIYTFQQAMLAGKNIPPNFEFVQVIRLFLKNCYKKRPVDWVYYEILSNIFANGDTIDEEDRKEIEKAKKILADKVDAAYAKGGNGKKKTDAA